MYLLERICLHNWNTIEARDVEIRGATGIIGPTGVGKSSLLDAIQTVIAGANTRSLDLNASTDGKSDRSIREYCLGYIDDIGSDPLRERCETTLALVFRDQETGQPISVGLMLYADKEDNREQVTSRFVVKGIGFRLADFTETTREGDTYVLSHAEMITRLRENRRGRFEQYNASGTRFVEAYLGAMRGRAAVPSVRHFLNNFRNMVAFRPVEDATTFVRRYVLPPDPLDVERIRDSIDHWRHMEDEVRRLQAMLHAIQQVRGRFVTWGKQTVLHNALAFTAANCERLRLERLKARDETKLAQARAELERLRAAQANHTKAIEEIDESIRSKSVLLSQSSASAKVEAIQARQRAAEGDRERARTELGQRFQIAAGLAVLDRVKQFIPMSLHGAVASAQALRALAREDAAALAAREDELAALERQAFELLRAREPLDANSTDLATQISAKAREIEELEEQVRSAGETGAVLSRPVRTFMDILHRAGIEAKPLPDLVEIRDERWAYALEGLLGANREALIVDPIHQDKALDLLHQNKAQLYTCRLVQTRRMDRVNPKADEGSIATIVAPSGAYAGYVRKFIDYHVGRIRMVETQRALDDHSAAVMPNGKTSSGLTLRVQGEFKLILGRTARNRALEQTREQIETLQQAQADLVAQKKRIDSALDALRRAEDSGTRAITACLDALAEAEGRIASAKAELKTVDDPEAARLQEEIAELTRERAAYKAELDNEIAPDIRQSEAAERELDVQLQKRSSAIDDQKAKERKAIEAEQAMAELTALLDDPEDIEAARAKVAAGLLHAPEESAAARLIQMRLDAEQTAQALYGQMRDNERRAQNGYHRFLKDYDIESPLGENADNVAMLSWVLHRERELEENELRPHRQKVEEARASMETALKEDLLNKLSDKFKTLKSQLRVLNKRLASHTFTGMRYHFGERVDPRLSRLHALAERIADSPEQGLEAQTGAGSPEVREAMDQIEEILDKTSDTSLLEDYRNYYTFELIMRGADGVETNLSRRTKKGSGGQKQAPYYVAIAAAMASVYFPASRSRNPEGMGLVLFDEAFNRLDIPNTQAILRFYKDLNLQVVVAAPEEKRMSFLEVMDTIVSVNKLPSDTVMYIDWEHPRARAIAEMQAANPEHLGLDGYRKRLAGSTESRDAAE